MSTRGILLHLLGDEGLLAPRSVGSYLASLCRLLRTIFLARINPRTINASRFSNPSLSVITLPALSSFRLKVYHMLLAHIRLRVNRWRDQLAAAGPDRPYGY